MNLTELTPIEKVGNIFLKRDDKFEIFNSRGGKARSCYMIVKDFVDKNYNSFVTAGSRFSPQCEILSNICEGLGLKAYCVIPTGQNTSVIENIEKNKNTTIIRIKYGYNNVIISRAKKLAEENNYAYVPFGMECLRNIEITQEQVLNLPSGVKRIIVPVGSGMTLISIVNGLNKYNMKIPVVGIQVGKDPFKNIKKYCKGNNFTILKSQYNYDEHLKDVYLGDVNLDEVYEAKCLEYLKDDDLLWIIGHRN